MVTLILGLILLAAPLLLTGFFPDKKRGFIYIFFFVLVFQIALAFFTQLMGVFCYQAVFWTTLASDIAVLAVIAGYRKNFSLKLSHIDWIALLVIIIAAATLYQVHYNYTGKISFINDSGPTYHQAENLRYEYPYFPDEWYAVSLIKGSLDTHGFPLKNTLDNSPMFNLEMFTHSFLAEIILLLGLNPLMQYSILAIAVSTLIILLSYLFLRLSGVSKLAAAICSLSILYIASCGTLPGIQHLIPVSLGILFSLFGFCFIEMSDTKMVFLSFFIVSLFYPLLSPFYVPAILIYLFSTVKKLKENKLKIIGYFAVVLFIAAPVISIIFLLSPLYGFLNFVFSKLYYFSFVTYFIPQFQIYNVIPIWVIILACAGIPYILKNKKWFLWQLAIGLFYWFLYLHIFYRIIIEFEREVFFTSIIICIAAGFGLDRISDYLVYKFKDRGAKTVKCAQIAVLAGFLIMVPFYTRGEDWKKLVLYTPLNGGVYYPGAPANNYLTSDDLEIFKNIKNKRFLSVPWKGTVIGVATDNYPAVTKQGTISMGQINAPEIFSGATCAEKNNLAKEAKLDYIYLYQFDCPGFEKISQSSEGFVLYKFNLSK